MTSPQLPVRDVIFRNFLLSDMGPADLQALSPHLTEVSLSQSQVIFDIQETPSHLYFPSSAVLSVVTEMSDGRSAESLTVGRESAAALLEVLVDTPMESRIFAQVAGVALRVPAEVVRRRLAESPEFAALIWRHVHSIAVQTSQFVACNVLHDARQRLARWLLMTADRTGSATFALTQDYMAVMVGVQRTTVSMLAAGFKSDGLIQYSRGRVEILDEAGMTRVACECWRVAHRQFEALRS